MNGAGSRCCAAVVGLVPAVGLLCLVVTGASGGEPARFSTLGRSVEPTATNSRDDAIEASSSKLKLEGRSPGGPLIAPPVVSLPLNSKQQEEQEQRRNWIFLRPGDAAGRSSPGSPKDQKLTLGRESAEPYDAVRQFMARRQEQRNAPGASANQDDSPFASGDLRADDPLRSLLGKDQPANDALRFGASPGTLGTAGGLLDVLSPRRTPGWERTPEQRERMNQFKAMLDSPAPTRFLDAKSTPTAVAEAARPPGALPSARSLEDLTAAATRQPGPGTPLGGYGVLGSRAMSGVLDDAAQRSAYANSVRDSSRFSTPAKTQTDLPAPLTIPRRAF